MSRALDGDDPFEDEEYRRQLARERVERQREHAPIGRLFTLIVHPRDADKARAIFEPKDGPPPRRDDV